MYDLLCGAVQHVHIAAFSRRAEGRDSAAGAAASLLNVYGLLGAEGLAIIGRRGQPHAAILLTVAVGISWRMPGDIHAAVAISRDCRAAIESEMRSDDVALGLEGRAVIIQTRVEERRFLLALVLRI